MPIRVTMIGAGSIGFTRKLVRDILAVPELRDTEFRFTDINEDNLAMVETLVRREIEGNNLPATLVASTDRREMLKDADYVFCVIRQGGLEAFRTDIEIPLKYGVDQCVGDTLCAGGLMYAQRGIPALLDFCRDIREVAKPGALFFNYANPMAMNTWACNQYGGVPTIGLCHGVQGTQYVIAKTIEKWAHENGMLPEGEELWLTDIDAVAAGINHQTWFLSVHWRGIDFTPMLPELMAKHPRYSVTNVLRVDVLQRFGYMSTESNGHLSEYLPWYRKNPDDIENWIDYSRWQGGQTAGYLRDCISKRNWFETEYPEWLKEPVVDIASVERTIEHASYIIEAIHTGRVYRGNLNMVNNGHITNLQDGCVVEIPCYIDRNGISTTVVGDLPLACAATCAASVRVQQMGVEAAVKGDVTLLKQAMLHDPLTAAVCNPEEIWQMTDEMLVAQAAWLPQYAAHIDAAKQRLADHEKNGTRVKPKHAKTMEDVIKRWETNPIENS